jgi:hypothetical protein
MSVMVAKLFAGCSIVPAAFGQTAPADNTRGLQPTSQPSGNRLAADGSTASTDWYAPLKDIPLGPGTLSIDGSVRVRGEYLCNLIKTTPEDAGDADWAFVQVKYTF